MRTLGSCFLCCSLALIACGGDDDGGGDGAAGDPIAPAEAEDLCGQLDDHGYACSWAGDIVDRDWNCGEAAMVFRADAFQAVVDCGINLACDGDAQTCLDEALSVDPLPIHDEYASTCESKSSECDLTPDSDVSTLLLTCNGTYFAPYATAVMETILDCFAMPCADVVACLDDTL